MRLLILFSAVFCQSYVDAQNISNLVLSPSPLRPGDEATITVHVAPLFTPTWFVSFYLNQVHTVLVSAIVHPVQSTISTSVLPTSNYADRLSVNSSTPFFNAREAFDIILKLRNIEESDGGLSVTVEAGSFFVNSSLLNLSLVVASGVCPNTSNMLMPYVVANSNEVGSNGTFACPSDGFPFFKNGSSLLSLSTQCTRASTWSRLNDVTCLFPPEPQLSAVYVAKTNSLLLICQYSSDFPSSTIFYVGDTAYEAPTHAQQLDSFDSELFGKSVSCQGVTPYTKMFNDSGRSESVPFVLFEEPTQQNVTCRWRFNQSESCNVTFMAHPIAEFVGLGKDGEAVINDGSNDLTNDNGVYTYHFHKKQVSSRDFGSYRMLIRYSRFPGLKYVISFTISPLPVSCVWFDNERGVCEVPIIHDHPTPISLSRNGSEIADESSLETSSGAFQFVVARVSMEDEGNYTLLYRFPSNVNGSAGGLSSNVNGSVDFSVKVLPYPFNAGLVIGLTLAIFFFLIIILVVWWRCSNAGKAKKAEAPAELVGVGNRTTSRTNLPNNSAH